MLVTIVGAGALGRVYGARLAASGVDVAFVVRPARAGESTAFAIEQVNGDHAHHTLAAPDRRVDVPAEADAIVVTVRFDQLDGVLLDVLQKGASAPVVFLTPLMPAQQERLRAALGSRLVPGMPGVSGYVDERGVVRYWVVSVAATLLDDPGDGPLRQSLDRLARALTGAGLPSRLERDVAKLNAATTAAFFPLIAAVGAGGGIDGVLADKALLKTALDAADECSKLASKIGKLASWASLLTKYVGGFTLRPGVALAKKLYPESIRFVDTHFGPKLWGQHVEMGTTILALGREHGVKMPSLEALVERVRRAR